MNSTLAEERALCEELSLLGSEGQRMKRKAEWLSCDRSEAGGRLCPEQGHSLGHEEDIVFPPP